MSDDNVAVETGVAEVAAPKDPVLSTLYAAVAQSGGKWKLVTVRPDHGADYEQVFRYFAASELPVRLFNANSFLSAADVTVRVLNNAAASEGIKYVGEIDPVLYEGPKL